MIVSLENQHSTYQNMTIWKDEETVNDYIGILVKGLVYGNNENIEDNIEMTKFLLKNADIKIIASQIPRILGPLIRVSSYQLYQRQK
jgi:ABC-type xylose transport system substrate-binding protein